MPMWHEDKELSKYSSTRQKTDLAKMGQVASVLTGVLLRGLHLLASAHVCLYWLCVHFRDSVSRELSWS